MKTLLTLLLAFLCSPFAHAQNTGYAALPKDSATQKVTYAAVVPVPGASQAELFGRMAEWMARQPDRVPLGGAAAEATSGVQVCHLSFKQPPLSFTDTHSNRYIFTVAVHTKDGKYFYRVDDFGYQNENPALLTKDVQQRVPLESYAAVKENKHVTATLTDFNKRITALISSLNQAMAGAKTTPKGW